MNANGWGEPFRWDTRERTHLPFTEKAFSF
jgi:hypothetical protein